MNAQETNDKLGQVNSEVQQVQKKIDEKKKAIKIALEEQKNLELNSERLLKAEATLKSLKEEEDKITQELVSITGVENVNDSL